MATYSEGLAKFDGQNWTVYNSSNSGLPENTVMSIAIDDLGNKWIGTNGGSQGGGLSRFDGTNWTTYNSGNSGLSNDYVEDIAIDGSGTLWIATYFGGLVQFDGINWTTYDPSNSGLPGYVVRVVEVDETDTKWIGVYNYGLTKFDGMNWTTYNSVNSLLPDDMVISIAFDGNGTKWIGTFNGLAVFNENGIPVSVNENGKAENSFTVFPNPVKDQLNIELPREMKISFIEIYTMQGKVVKSQKITNNQNSIDVRDLPGGVYIIRLHTDEGEVMKKMVKQ